MLFKLGAVSVGGSVRTVGLQEKFRVIV
uniref:Uncharacterized protein n=1 Tax=Rhizophora mucronata TaxID=61149 RepID=A0A2P2JTF0_RHIMU